MRVGLASRVHHVDQRVVIASEDDVDAVVVFVPTPRDEIEVDACTDETTCRLDRHDLRCMDVAQRVLRRS